MSKLQALIEKHKLIQTDKSTGHSYIPHVYDKFLEPYEDSEINLLEIGTREGDSVKLWAHYLTKANIYGMDNDQTNRYKHVDMDRVTMHFGDAYTPEMVDKVPDMDIIIDDGPHTLESQLKCLELYLDKLKPGGVLLIEDIQEFDSITELEKKYIELGGEKEVEYYDLRSVKGRYDDVVVVFRK